MDSVEILFSPLGVCRFTCISSEGKDVVSAFTISRFTSSDLDGDDDKPFSNVDIFKLFDLNELEKNNSHRRTCVDGFGITSETHMRTINSVLLRSITISKILTDFQAQSVPDFRHYLYCKNGPSDREYEMFVGQKLALYSSTALPISSSVSDATTLNSDDSSLYQKICEELIPRCFDPESIQFIG